MAIRGTDHSNERGSAQDRRRRKQWLLDTCGDGVKCACVYCGIMLTFATLTVDRIIPGVNGGRYVRGNIQPACGHCNSSEGAKLRGRGHEASAEALAAPAADVVEGLDNPLRTW